MKKFLVAITLLLCFALLVGCDKSPDTLLKSENDNESVTEPKKTFVPFDVDSALDTGGVFSFYMDENGSALLNLIDNDGRIGIYVSNDSCDYLSMIDNALYMTAAKKILDCANENEQKPMMEVFIGYEGYLILYSEFIVSIDPPETSGCVDHKHIVFEERISLEPISDDE